MNYQDIKILMVEDNPMDVRLVREMLIDTDSSPARLDQVELLNDALKRLGDEVFDVVLLDLSLPDASGLDTMARVQEAAPSIPIVIMSGMQDEALALEAVHNGAQDYLVKGQVDGNLLIRSLTYAIARKQAEDTLKKANEELKRVDEMKSDFISTVSHELRTPLTSLKNAIELLATGQTGPVNDDQQHFLGMAGRNIDRLVQMISDLLDLSKMEAGKIEVEFMEVDVYNTIRNVIDTFYPQATTSSLSLVNDCPADIAAIYADPERIEQVLYNLLSNALKFTASGGQIVLSAREAGEEVEISVADTGIGLSPDEAARVFDRFYQVGDSLTRTSTGTGLGLSICKQLIDAQGGTIAVESEAGKGSRFFINIPVYSQQAIEIHEFEQEIQKLSGYPFFSLLLLELGQEDIFSRHPPVKETSSVYLNQLMDITRKILPRVTDIIISQPAFSRLALILTVTQKSGAVVVKKKIEHALRQTTFSVSADDIPIVRILGPSTYPDDGARGKDLIESARSAG